LDVKLNAIRSSKPNKIGKQAAPHLRPACGPYCAWSYTWFPAFTQ